LEHFASRNIWLALLKMYPKMHAGHHAKCQLLSGFTYAGMSQQILVELLGIKFHKSSS
jgi:hypothetical protein